MGFGESRGSMLFSVTSYTAPTWRMRSPKRLLAPEEALWSKAFKMPDVELAEARAIAREAYIYGFPLVDSYRIQYSYFVDRNDPEFKGNWNELHNTARVYTPDDKAIQTPNSDTPYSFVGADLREEPLEFIVP